MTVSQYNLISAETTGREIELVVHMVNSESKRSFVVRPMDLFGSESRLDGGRFHAFDRTITVNPVCIGPVNYPAFKQAFQNTVEWLAENAEGRWGFHLFYEDHALLITPTFYFDDLTDALLFQLSIQRKSI